MAKIHTLALTLLASATFASAQHIILLKDGTRFQGRFTSGTASYITFVDDNGDRHRFSVGEVQGIRFGPPRAGMNDGYDSGYNNNPNPGAYNNPGGTNSRYNNNGYDADRNRGNYRGNAYANLNSGTEIAVRTNETIDVRDSQGSSRSYSASIDRDVVDHNGNVVVPRGSDAQLVVRSTGNREMTLDLQSVNVNGRSYTISTEDVTRSGENRGLGGNKRTGEYVGGGAVLGTLLGAVGGGGKGALIGALAGAAAGGTLQVLTRGSEIRVPNETVLRFRLDQPVYLY